MKFGELKEGKEYKWIKFKSSLYTMKNGGLFCLKANDYSAISMLEIMTMDFVEVKQFTNQELTLLNMLKPEFQWVVKNKNGNVMTSNKNIIKSNGRWITDGDILFLADFNLTFDCLSFDDETATNWRKV